MFGLIAACACADRPVGPSDLANHVNTPSETKTVASILTCGAQFTTVATLSVPADQYEPASVITDTVTSCLTWTGSDYTNTVVVNGTSEVNALHDPRGTYTFSSAMVGGPTPDGPLSVPADAPTALDFVNATPETRAAVAVDPYFMFRSCPYVIPPPPDGGGLGGPPILPSVDDDITWDPCGSPVAGIRSSIVAVGAQPSTATATKLRRATAQDSLLKGLLRVARPEVDGVIRYTGIDATGAVREVRMHPTAHIPLSEVRRRGRESARIDFDWRRTPNGYVRIGERVTEDIQLDGKPVRVTSTIRHRAIRIQLD